MADELTRRLLIEQTRKEILDEIRKYQVGWAQDGAITTKRSGDWNGIIFVIPEEKYQELFKEG